MSSNWKSLAEAMIDREPPTAAQIVFIDMILGVIDDWIAGDIALDEAEKEAGDGWLRFQVIRKLPIESDAGKKMRAFVNALCARNDTQTRAITTKHGLITPELMGETNARVMIDTHPESGDRTVKIQFPYKYPKNADPLYPSTIKLVEPEPEPVASPHAADWFRKDDE